MFWIFVFRSFLYLYFMVVLAGTCGREALLTDYVIAEKVSAFGILLMIAVYISSSSSCLATLYGTPRVLQSIASENVIPSIAPLAEGVRFISSQCCQLCLKIGVGTPDFFSLCRKDQTKFQSKPCFASQPYLWFLSSSEESTDWLLWLQCHSWLPMLALNIPILLFASNLTSIRGVYKLTKRKAHNPPLSIRPNAMVELTIRCVIYVHTVFQI